MSQTNEAPAPRTKRAKSVTRLMRRIYFCTGERGGVGKTTVAIALIETLKSQGRTVEPVDADGANRDLQERYGLEGCIDLQRDEAYVALLDLMERIDTASDVVVSLPAAVLAGANVRGKSFVEGLSAFSTETGRELIPLWVIDDKELSVAMLAEFAKECPIRIDVVQNAFFADDFAIFDGSNVKQILAARGGSVLTLPRLKPSIMSRLLQDKLGFDQTEAAFPIGTRIEFRHWRREVEKVFREAGYLNVE